MHVGGGVLGVEFEQAFVDVAEVLNGEVLVVDSKGRGRGGWGRRSGRGRR